MMSWFVFFALLLALSVDGHRVAAATVRMPNDKNVDKFIFSGPKGIIRLKGDSLHLMCSSRNFVNESLLAANITLYARKLTVFECIFPPTPIANTLQNLNINASAIENLSITSTNKLPLIKGNYTAGLNIKTLTLEAPNSSPRNYLINNSDFLEPLLNLTTLIIHGTTLPIIPDNVHLETLRLILNTPVNFWGNCQHLKELNIRLQSNDFIPPNWPSNCLQLARLKLESMAKDATLRTISVISGGAKNLQHLHIENCGLTAMPSDVLNVAQDLNYLNLTHNGLLDNSMVNFPLLRNLTVLDLSHNKLVGIVLFEIVKQMPALHTLILDNNLISNVFCNDYSKLTSFALNLPSLSWLSLNSMFISPDCFNSIHFSKLSILELNVQDSIADLKLQGLPTTDASHLEVNMRKRFIQRVVFDKEEYEAINAGVTGNLSSFWLNNKTKLTVMIDEIDCDCENYWLSLAIRENPELVSFPETQCHRTETPFLQENLKTLDCNKGLFEDCIIRTAGTLGNSGGKSYKTSSVECHNIKTPHIDYPIYDEKYYKFIGLNISGNSVGNLRDFLLPDSLEWIDLRGNHITRLTADETSRLFKFSQRRVWLSQNLFICDCESREMIDALHKHHNQVVDFDAITCINNAKPLSSIKSNELCQIKFKLWLGILGVIIIILFTTIALMWFYGLRTFLFSRGWCLSYQNKGDNEEELLYDVFVSFSHDDWEYVMDQLLPRLQSKPDLFRVCVHYHDWIPAQIERSISHSAHTIIVLSRNFISSLWGSLEFRSAVASLEKKYRSRLVVVVLDDVLSEELDVFPQQQSFLSRKLLSCNDPWFWEKLSAMLHQN